MFKSLSTEVAIVLFVCFSFIGVILSSLHLGSLTPQVIESWLNKNVFSNVNISTLSMEYHTNKQQGNSVG